MDILGLRPEVPRDPVGQVVAHHGYAKIALVDLGREVSEALRGSWPPARPILRGGVIEGAWLQPLVGAGSTAASSLLAGNVFLATANPATLMTIGTGLGSAVMGPAGIVAHAPFVAASTALIPVVAPVMLFVTVSSVITGARLDRVQRALGALSEGVERVRHLVEAEDRARFESAADHLDDIGSQFEQGQRFTEGAACETPGACGLAQPSILLVNTHLPWIADWMPLWRTGGTPRGGSRAVSTCCRPSVGTPVGD